MNNANWKMDLLESPYILEICRVSVHMYCICFFLFLAEKFCKNW